MIEKFGFEKDLIEVDYDEVDDIYLNHYLSEEGTQRGFTHIATIQDRKYTYVYATALEVLDASIGVLKGDCPIEEVYERFKKLQESVEKSLNTDWESIQKTIGGGNK